MVKDNGFFWDTIQLSSMQANWFFENGMRLVLPENIDSGHPPGMGIYLAGLWKMFGRNLLVSHFAMMPFLFGIVLLIFQLGAYFFSKREAMLILALCMIDSSILGQAALVSPDIILVFSFLLVVNGMLYFRNWWIVFGGILLAIISMRGMMILLAMYIFRIINFYFFEKRIPTILEIFKLLIPFLPGAILGFSFLIFHYVQTGWIGFHGNSAWALSFQRVGFNGLLKNILVFIWRLLDFGRVFLFVILLLLIVHHWKHKIQIYLKTKQLLALIFMLSIFFLPNFLMYKGVNAQRYLLPLLILINFVAVHFLWKSELSKQYKNILLFLMFLGLFTGNFWVYPKNISQSWDSTLAHLPYYELRKEMIAFIESEKIPFQNIGTVFPNLRSFDDTELNGRHEKFAPKDFEQDNYIFYSNVFNGFSDEEIDALFNDWKPIKTLNRRGVCVVLFLKE